jgi:hypothetical protein
MLKIFTTRCHNLNPPSKYINHEGHEGHEGKNSIQNIPMKSFWKSRNLFSKRFLAAGGKSLRWIIGKKKIGE